MVQLRNGHSYSMESARQQELTLMTELYPDLDPEVHRITASELMHMIELASVGMPCAHEERLHRLHHLLELCTIEHEFEVQSYQAAHRRLLEHQEEFRQMLQIPNVPPCAFEPWASYIANQKDTEKANMKESRSKTKAILRAISYAEKQVKDTETVVAAQGRADRLLRESNQILEKQMARLAANAEVAEQIHDDRRKQSPKAAKCSEGEIMLMG